MKYGNKEDRNIPYAGTPLLIGSQLDMHFQSLLPVNDNPEHDQILDLSNDLTSLGAKNTEVVQLEKKTFNRKS